MTETAQVRSIVLAEQAARPVLLAQAIETADTDGKLLDTAQRERLDRQAWEAARPAAAASGSAAIERLLCVRAALVLQAVAERSPALAALAQPRPWLRWLAVALPLAALAGGILGDQIANPHRINLLSAPLLALVLWNLVTYALLLVGFMLSLRRDDDPAPFSGLRAWLAGPLPWPRRWSHTGAQAAAAFALRWQAATAALNTWRWRRVLHLCAAGWALGVAVSVFAGGVLARYSVQWESTFLDAGQVHQVLRLLFSPVTALFPGARISLDEVRSLEAGAGQAAAHVGVARRWVFLNAMLLALVVVLPRLVLGGFSLWRERSLARRVAIDLQPAYYQRLVALLNPAEIRLGLLAHHEDDRAALLRVFGGAPGPVLDTPTGESLHLLELPARLDPSQQQAAPPASGWLHRLLREPRASAPLDGAQHACDVVLHVVRDEADALAGAPVVQWLGKPVLTLARKRDDAVAGRDRFVVWNEVAACWFQERLLLAAIATLLPGYKTEGFARLAALWDERNRRRFRESMALCAGQLVDAARETQEAGDARQAAQAALLERLGRRDSQAQAQLLALHGISGDAAAGLNHAIEQSFVAHGGISAGRAGVAGAATGAAMGASVDLVTGGLTLGAAAALGALIGGGTTFAAAAWKNRSQGASAALVQLSDAMLQAMAEAALLRYLAVAHHGRDSEGGGLHHIRPAWRSEVVAAVEVQREALGQQWSQARDPRNNQPRAALASLLETMALAVLVRLYPAAGVGGGNKNNKGNP
jgi:hypothetical protein